MARWSEIEAEAPELAARARAIFDAHKHKTLATLRRDGSPRISGTEMELRVTELVVTGLGGDPPDRLVIESWHPARGVERRER